jgi:hypothetical protein
MNRAYLAVPVPRGMTFDKYQTAFFESPQNVEKIFQRRRGENVSSDYLNEQLNNGFRRVYVGLQAYRGFNTITISDMSDVMQYHITMTPDTEDNMTITLHLIIIRPCFANRGLLTTLVYVLLLAACARDDVKAVIVERCVGATVNALTKKFGNLMEQKRHVEKMQDPDLADILKLMRVDSIAGDTPDCVFTDFERIGRGVSLVSLNLDHKVRIARGGWPELIEECFPTAAQLNRPE